MKSIKIKILVTAVLLAIVLPVTACKKAEHSPDIQLPEQAPATESVLEVQTDFGILTPFVPLHTMHTRLREGAMPELVPSSNFGMLLPYSSAIVMYDGSLFASKYGFVTIDGVVITDLIYDGIERAEYIHSWYVGEADEKLPAYKLYKHETDPETAWDYFNNRKMAACALDGSWVTEFDYIEIIFTQDVIVLFRDDLTFDIDVIDYDGNHLYNMLDFDWARNAQADTMTGRLFEVIADSHAHARIRNNRYAFIDLLTGNIRSTRYIAADPFIEGYAPIGIGIPGTYFVIWGLINTDFQVVIAPRYYNLPFFKYGRAIVERRDGSQFVINTKGDVLFNVPDDYWIDHSYEGPTFVMSNKFGTDPYPTFLTSEFEELIPPEGVMIYDSNLRYLNNGWYTIGDKNGSYLFGGRETHYFPGLDYIYYFDGDIIIYRMRQDDIDGVVFKNGVMTLGGNELISPESALITPITQNDTTIAFVVITGSSGSFPAHELNQITYRLVDINGNIKTQGRGVLTYHDAIELYSIQGENHFSWLDKNANPIITIPLLSSTFD